VDLCAGCSVICVFVSDKVDADIAQQLHKQGVRMIAVRAAGFNNIDVGACDKLGITCARVPAYSPYAVAEMATALILSLNRKTHHAYQRVRDYNFSLDRLVGFDMHGKTVGVFGTGKIGQCFIDIMLGFGCHVLCYDVVKAKQLEGRKNVQYADMDTVFAHSDIISLHLPLTPETKHLISSTTLAKMKPHCVIINTGRGELVNTADLLDALRSERLGGAGLDVYEEEGEYFYSDLSEYVIKDRQLLEVINQPNCLVTSHQAFLTQEALVAIAKTTIDNIKEMVVDGKSMAQLKNSINKDDSKDNKKGAEQPAGVKSHATSAHHSTGAHHGQQPQHSAGIQFPAKL
jgi:D-lactate dehydrogenase